MKPVRILSIFIILFIIAFLIVWKTAPDIISSSLSKKMQVEVKINDIAVSSDTVNIDKLQISNPKGSPLPTAFSADNIKVSAPVLNYLKDEIVIDSIEINQVYMSLIFTSPTATSGNWSTIIDNLKKSSPPEPKEKVEVKEKGKAKKDKTKSVLIKKLILTNINADLIYLLQGTTPKKLTPIPRLEFTNVSSESGISLDQITNLILEQTLKSVLEKENLQDIFKKTLSPNGILDKITSPFKQ